jgi:hypothetical protein
MMTLEKSAQEAKCLTRPKSCDEIFCTSTRKMADDDDPLSNAMQQMSVDGEDEVAGVDNPGSFTHLHNMQEEMERKEKRAAMMLAESKATLAESKAQYKKTKELGRLMKQMKETSKRVYISSDPSDYPDDPADAEDAKNDPDYSPAASSAKKEKKPPKKKASLQVAAAPLGPGKIAVLFHVCKDTDGNVFVPREGAFFFDFASEEQGAKVYGAALEWERTVAYEILAKVGDNVEVVGEQVPTKITGIDRGYKNR